MLSPVEHTKTAESMRKYRGEPYVVAADVSYSPGRLGRSGWTWYTGSAGWMYRIWLEDVLGFRLQGARLRVAPAMPVEWTGFQIQYRFKTALYRIVVERVGIGTVAKVQCDGRPCQDGWIDLRDDGKDHDVNVQTGLEAVEPVPSS
jgi:cyclic beta-1,2-glucan synthetase